jgi:hypothetical protein
MSKAELRDEIEALTKKYLLNGGLIEILPKRNYVPKWRKWMLDYDWSYTPWILLGGEDEILKREMIESQVGVGCFATQAVPTEE